MFRYDIEPGSHILWIYSDEEDLRENLGNLINDGLERGERVIVLGLKEDIERFNEIFKDIRNITIFTLSKDILSSIKDVVGLIEDGRSNLCRIINLSESCYRYLGTKEMLELASKVESVCKDKHIWICIYSKKDIKVRDLLDIVKSYQFLIINDRLFRNYLYLSPEKILKDDIDYAIEEIENNLTERDNLWRRYKDIADLYIALFENTGTATIVIEDLLITSINNEFERLTGFKKEEVENKKTWLDFIPYREDLERMLNYRELRLKDPSLAPSQYETRIRDKYGKIKDVMLSVKLIPNTKKFVASLLDITEIKRINRLLKMLSISNQELVRIKDEKELKYKILKIVKDYGGYEDVSIDQTTDGKSTLRVVTDREITDEEREILRELSQDIDYGIRSIRDSERLSYSENVYRDIFENVPIALLDVDLTETVEYLKSLKDSSIEDLEGYFETHPEAIDECINKIKTISLNRETFRLYKIRDIEKFDERIYRATRVIPGQEKRRFLNEILNYFRGSKTGELTTINYILDGEERYIRVKWFAYPQPVGDIGIWNRVVVALIDITEEKRLSETLNRNLKELKKTFEQTVEVISNIAEMRDPYTAGHQKGVSEIACGIARMMGLSEDKIERIRIGGLLHDIGKISIPAEILNKPGRLSGLEFEMVKLHPKAGYEILSKVDFLKDIAEMVLQHHERLNGSGYPRGLKDGQIMLEAKIIGVADVVEAMGSHRPYRPPLSKEEIIKELRDNRGILYDPDVVDAFLKL